MKLSFAHKVAIALGLGTGVYFTLPLALQVGIDPQLETSVVAGRFYLSSPLLAPRATGTLSPYRVYYRQLSPEQQEQMQAFSKAMANRPDYFKLVSQWVLQQEYQPQSLSLYPQANEIYVTLGPWRDNLTLAPCLGQSKAQDELFVSFLPHQVDLPGKQAVINSQAYLTEQGEQKYFNQAVLLAGDLHIFLNHTLIRSLEPQTKFVKYLLAYPHDIVDLTAEGLFINGVYIKNLPPVLEQALASLPQGSRRIILDKNEYWAVGDAFGSIDSLYFGALKGKQIQARVFTFF
ncbi:hypothetical protein CJP74_00875 [Psittacicella melopsittaci]|uniref:Peptidase S26 domain-containing protein n=1 Tax=Psittacicella melopsittaci TaxID=2028576 RepID=A0A3A1Y6D0_9GAMM|nr:S26 family signal peptidase [Psittacicella melopsittaci]RIY33823.1 hypothetical protein CJP74_00875 [Psittacicella melopsittaci]